MNEHPNLHYVTRPDGTDAKAGNLNYALFQSKNTLIVVLDADHRCKSDFLLRTIPHLLAVVDGHRAPSLSSKTTFVQTTQVFYNEKQPLITLLDGKHSLFYKLMMPSFNGMGCMFCVGTGYVMQRVALEGIGGYVSNCAVEDVPEMLSEFFTQRERWVAGLGQLLLYHCDMLTSALPLKYRMAYLVGAWYWLVMLIFLFLILVRMTLFVIFRSITGIQTTT